VTRTHTQLNMENWGVRGSNHDPCINYASTKLRWRRIDWKLSNTSKVGAEIIPSLDIISVWMLINNDNFEVEYIRRQETGVAYDELARVTQNQTIG
jgi:hypothetical protein